MIEYCYNANYASEVMKDLPTHAYIDKTTCGVGMTSGAHEVAGGEQSEPIPIIPLCLLCARGDR